MQGGGHALFWYPLLKEEPHEDVEDIQFEEPAWKKLRILRCGNYKSRALVIFI